MLVSECINFRGRLYKPQEKVKTAVCELEWAYGVLAIPSVIYPNGKDSHEVANEAIDKYEDVLIDYLVMGA